MLDQAGLRGKLPLYTSFTVDEISIPAVKDAAVGIYETRYWSPDLKNPANQARQMEAANRTKALHE